MAYPSPDPAARAVEVGEPASAPIAATGYDVPRDRWSAFLRRFVRRHAGAPVSVALSSGDSREHAQHEMVRRARNCPFHDARRAVRTDGSDEILITVGEPPYMLEPYFVVHPTRIRVEQAHDGKLVIRIEADSGRALVLCFSRRVGRTTGPLTLVG